jgi:GNAT superfamily N-acetyltransferase
LRLTIAGVSGLAVRPVPESERGRAIATVVAAFADDPVERWLYPASADYEAHFPEFVAAFAGEAFRRETVWRLAEFAAVAFWLPPDSGPDGDAIVGVLRATVPAAKHETLFSILEQMDAAHPTYSHWYLPWLGVAPDRQGTGLGGELLRRCLEIVDANHMPAFLETPNPRTIPFYERHGFHAIGTAQAGDCPPITSMLRTAR